MDSYLLMWGLLTFIMVPGCQAELCDDDPPEIAHATFKAVAYKEGTMLNCECKRGFRRIKSGSPYMLCTGNSSHSSWDNQCQCTSSAARNTTKQVTPQPEEQKERKTTEMQSPMQPVDQASLPGEEKPQASPEGRPESETSCLVTTTDFQIQTEVAATMETFIFTTEYQVAVAGCVFLLISVLLLSGLTWQRRQKKSRRTI
ncbi:interleukin-2 receptor subunit alpha isoform X5 [Symphalangus syndactylus]|uniref:interleukin-2 receptor subunit alpha isoform X5 n=1 Tax=Symphalangus syndactylus TaxID=9590 RepID=UPI002442864C|nr:interleukin-2 receptor subunit alpha isoform X3 [Symphalangus syndactylus]